MAAKRIIRIVRTALLILIAATIVACASFFVWIGIEPREIRWFTPYIEKTLNPKDGRFRINAGHTYIAWDGGIEPVRISVPNVKLYTSENEVVATIPEMRVGIQLPALLSGQIKLKSVDISSASLLIMQDNDGRFLLGSPQNETPIALKDIFLRKEQKTEEQNDVSSMFDTGLSELTITNSSIGFTSQVTGTQLTIPSANAVIRERHGIFRGRIDFDTWQDGHTDTTISSLFTYEPHTHHLTIETSLADLTLSQFADLDPLLSPLQPFALPITGTIVVDVDLPQTLTSLSFSLIGKKGTIDAPEYWGKPLNIESFKADGKVTGLLEEISLETLSIVIDKTRIQSSTTIISPLEKLGLVGNLNIPSITAKKLIGLWPKGVAQNPYEWISESIKKGEMSDISFKFDISPEMIEQDSLPEGAIDGSIQFKNATLDYAPGFPEARNANGVVKFSGSSLTATIDSATILKHTILTAPGTVTVPNLIENNITVNISAPISSTAPEIIQILEATPYSVPTVVNLSPDTLSGDVTGIIEVSVLDNTSPVPDDVSFTASAQLENGEQTTIISSVDVTNVSGTMKATDSLFEFKGKGLANGQGFDLDLSTGDSTTLNLNSTLPVTSLATLGLDLTEYISGSIGFRGNLTQIANSNTQKISVNADLAALEVNLEEHGISKESGERGLLKFTGELDKDILNIGDYELEMPDGAAYGKARFDTKAKSLQYIKADSFTLGGHNLSGTYKPLAGDGHYIRLNADVLNLSHYLEDDTSNEAEKLKTEPEQDSIQALKRIPNLDIQASAKLLKLQKKRNFKDVKLNLNCLANQCQELDLMGQGGNTSFFARIGRQKNRRVFTAYAGDLGKLLSSLNIFDDLKKGELSVVGIFRDDLPGKPLLGKLTLGEHRVGDIPLLAKLLTVATFTGIVDSLSGEGLLFQKLIMPFKWQDFSLTLKDAKTAGPSVGITADGSIDIWDERIDLRGTVIPAHMFNDMLSSIPLIGNIYSALAGDGLVAVRYDMKGRFEDAEVSVNPLSALTPGILRGFFDIFNPVSTENAKQGAQTGKLLDAFQQDIDAVEMELPNFSDFQTNESP